MISAAVTTARIDRGFDTFLYASVGEDNNGMPLTVLSALARVDVDPWEEASKLTQLPRESAVTQLASLLGALRMPVVGLDPPCIAAALIALLPCPRDRMPPMLKAAFERAAPTKNPALVSYLYTVMTLMIFMLLSQWLMGSFEATRRLQSPAGPAPASAIESASTTSSEALQNAK
jgi:hypothetical protein